MTYITLRRRAFPLLRYNRSTMRALVVGTRGSALALRQTEIVIAAIKAAAPSIAIEVKTIHTEGDRRQDVSLDEFGGQGVFVKDIERTLLTGGIDLAVHSLKDMPAATPEGLVIAAVLERGDARDALVSTGGQGLAGLPSGARIGTDSRRRAVQLQALRSDVEPVGIRGNVDSRVRKAESGEYDAVCLAAAGLERLGLLGKAAQTFTVEEMVPAVGQGVLAVQARADDAETLSLLARIDHALTRTAITAERAFLRRLGAGCRLPVGAFGEAQGALLRLRALLATEDGRLFRGELQRKDAGADALGIELGERLLDAAGLKAML